jgi:cyclophilin family peptidyl-prolyl cis-trans isomerase
MPPEGFHSRLVMMVFFRSDCMKRISLVISLVFCALLATFFAMSPRVGAQEAPAGGKKAASKDIVKQWSDLLARREKLVESLEKLQERSQSADFEGKRKIEADFRKLEGEFLKEIEPEMAKIAPAILEKDPTDAIAAQFVIGKAVESQKYAAAVATLNKLIKSGTAKPNLIEQVLGMLLTENRFADVIEVADKLVEGKDVNPRLMVIDSMAHFYADDFAKAKELSQRAAEVDAASSAGAESFAKNCDEQAAFWKKELEIRAKEAKADDLPRVLFKTNKGDIVLELFENEAPNTVANFISLVEAKKYDGTKFHRVEPRFVAQGGDVSTVDKDLARTDPGGPGYTIACECYSEKARKHFQGSLSMAHAGKDTGGSQFFLTHCPTPHLNWAPGKVKDNHTVFGRIVEGLDVALALRTDDPVRQRDADYIVAAKVIRKRDHAYKPVKNTRDKK